MKCTSDSQNSWLRLGEIKEAKPKRLVSRFHQSQQLHLRSNLYAKSTPVSSICWAPTRSRLWASVRNGAVSAVRELAEAAPQHFQRRGCSVHRTSLHTQPSVIKQQRSELRVPKWHGTQFICTTNGLVNLVTSPNLCHLTSQKPAFAGFLPSRHGGTHVLSSQDLGTGDRRNMSSRSPNFWPAWAT